MSNKVALHNACLQLVNEQLNVLTADLESLKESRNNQTKSSVGDKHETARALMQLEEGKMLQQLHERKKVKTLLVAIDATEQCDIVKYGSLVITNKGNYYLSAPLGKILVNDQSYFALSTMAPMAKAMLGLKAKDQFTFNGNAFEITGIS